MGQGSALYKARRKLGWRWCFWRTVRQWNTIQDVTVLASLYDKAIHQKYLVVHAIFDWLDDAAAKAEHGTTVSTPAVSLQQYHKNEWRACNFSCSAAVQLIEPKAHLGLEASSKDQGFLVGCLSLVVVGFQLRWQKHSQTAGMDPPSTVFTQVEKV